MKCTQTRIPESCVFVHLVSPLVVLFVGFMEPLEGEALLEKAHHWGWTLELHSFTPISCSLSAASGMWMKDVFTPLPAPNTSHAFLDLRDFSLWNL